MQNLYYLNYQLVITIFKI